MKASKGSPEKPTYLICKMQDALFRLASSTESNLVAMARDARSSNITATVQSTSRLRKRVGMPAAALWRSMFWVLAFPESLSFTRAGSVSLMICTSDVMIRIKFPMQCSLGRHSA